MPKMWKECKKCGVSMWISRTQCPECGFGRPIIDKQTGYIWIYLPKHPLAHSNGYVLEHRLVIYNSGVEIPKGSHVHHKNEIKTDNRLENLEVINQKDHLKYHREKVGYVKNQFGIFPLRKQESI